MQYEVHHNKRSRPERYLDGNPIVGGDQVFPLCGQEQPARRIHIEEGEKDTHAIGPSSKTHDYSPFLAAGECMGRRTKKEEG